MILRIEPQPSYYGCTKHYEYFYHNLFNNGFHKKIQTVSKSALKTSLKTLFLKLLRGTESEFDP